MSASRSKRTRRRARLELLLGLGVFLLIQGGVAWLIEWWQPGWRSPFMASRVEHFQDRAQGPDGAGGSILFLGSSRFQYGIHVQVLEGELARLRRQSVAVFNYASLGGNPNNGLRQWRHLRASGARPSLAVVEAFPLHLHEGWSRRDPWVDFAPAGELDWDDIAQMEQVDPQATQLYLDNLLARGVPVLGHRMALTSRWMRNLQPAKYRRSPDSFQDIESEFPENERPAALRVTKDSYEAPLGSFRLSQEHLADLEALVAGLRQDGVATLLLATPEGPLFRSFYRPGARAEIDAALKAMCARHGAIFASAREWFDEEAFFDSHHLTVTGGRRFSARLAQEFIAPALPPGPAQRQ